jgi:ubiquinone/menaquinone biosynthesis C-methylase UbiE
MRNHLQLTSEMQKMNLWDRILVKDWYGREEPDEILVEFAASLSRKVGHRRVLDMGCGAGRHLLYMAKHGFEAHGVDLSETGLEMTKKRLRRQKLEANLVKSDMKKLPYVSSCFDTLVCLNTVYHQKLSGIQETISEVTRVLKKDGYVLMNFLSKKTYSYGKGIDVEEGTFMEQNGVEKEILHHFVDREEIQRLLGNLKIVDLRLKENRVDGKLRSRWIVVAMV